MFVKYFATAIAVSIVSICAIFAAPASASARCANADLHPATQHEANLAARATRCLVNRERTKRGRRALKANGQLFRSSRWQAKDMLEHEYFGHEREGGPDFVSRITRFGYGKDSSSLTLGENLAWGTSDQASPRQMVRGWMRSRGHRLNLLRGKFKDQAVYVLYVDHKVGGDYDDNGPLSIYVNQFGARG